MSPNERAACILAVGAVLSAAAWHAPTDVLWLGVLILILWLAP